MENSLFIMASWLEARFTFNEAENHFTATSVVIDSVQINEIVIN